MKSDKCLVRLSLFVFHLSLKRDPSVYEAKRHLKSSKKALFLNRTHISQAQPSPPEPRVLDAHRIANALKFLLKA
jgi:hypothetical protein